MLEGPVGLRAAGRWRLFRYQVRCRLGGSIPDLAYAVGGPQQIDGDPGLAARVVALAPMVPPLVWGRDEARTGEMWNSNSLVSWLLVQAGADADQAVPPPGGTAPGWHSGIAVAARAPRAREPG